MHYLSENLTNKARPFVTASVCPTWKSENNALSSLLCPRLRIMLTSLDCVVSAKSIATVWGLTEGRYTDDKFEWTVMSFSGHNTIHTEPHSFHRS